MSRPHLTPNQARQSQCDERLHSPGSSRESPVDLTVDTKKRKLPCDTLQNNDGAKKLKTTLDTPASLCRASPRIWRLRGPGNGFSQIRKTRLMLPNGESGDQLAAVEELAPKSDFHITERQQSGSPEEPALKVLGPLSGALESSFTPVPGKATAEDQSETPDKVVIPNTCPWCGAGIAEDLLSLAARDSAKPIKVCQQLIIHQRHQVQDYLEEWQARGYPLITWHSLPIRFGAHHEFLKRIIHGSSSQFRDLYDKMLREKTISDARSFSPGYYGPRGAEIMSDYLVQEFSSELKERAVYDPLIFKKGVPAFVQRVLVMELALKLIMEDMDVGEDEGVLIMTKSRHLGDCLCAPELE